MDLQFCGVERNESSLASIEKYNIGSIHPLWCREQI